MNLDEYRDVLSNKLMSEMYDMALRVIMEIENLPKEFEDIASSNIKPMYEKAKKKDKNLAKFLLALWSDSFPSVLEASHLGTYAI